jgi:hypothetical protein
MLKMCGGAELRRTPWYTGAVSGVPAASGVSHYTAARLAFTVISKKRRAAVGSGRGVISVFNPEGYDDRQVLHIQQLQINAAYSVMRQHDKAGDAWTQLTHHSILQLKRHHDSIK